MLAIDNFHFFFLGDFNFFDLALNLKIELDFWSLLPVDGVATGLILLVLLDKIFSLLVFWIVNEAFEEFPDRGRGIEMFKFVELCDLSINWSISCVSSCCWFGMVNCGLELLEVGRWTIDVGHAVTVISGVFIDFKRSKVCEGLIVCDPKRFLLELKILLFKLLIVREKVSRVLLLCSKDCRDSEVSFSIKQIIYG